MPRLLALAAALAASVAAPVLAQPPPERPTTPTVRASTPNSSTVLDPEYRIGIDDTLEITVFQAPEMSRKVQVGSGGRFVMPFVGEVTAAGLTAQEVSDLLTRRLDGRFLKDPQVMVEVKEAISQRITVDGAVVKPGVYPLTGATTLMQAVALANGADPRIANIRKVAIFRMEDGERRAQVFDLRKIRNGQAADPRVRADDIVVVETSGPRSFFAHFGGSLNLLNLLRPY